MKMHCVPGLRSVLGLKVLLLLYCTSVCVYGMNREYFIKIEEVSWNYAPSGMNIIQNVTVQEDQ